MSTAELLIPQPLNPPPPPPAAELATNMNNINTVNPAVTSTSTDGPRLTFPPFPEAPEGVHIEPFSTFQERGIAMDPGPDDAEVDTFGIPTVPLKPKHKTDECKTNTKRKRRADDDASRKKRGLSAKKVPWWQQWEDTESIRFSVGFDSHSTRFERLHAAAGDFRLGRTWPVDYQSETGPKFIYDKFLRYIGLTDGAPPPDENKKKKSSKGGQPVPEADEMSDDEVDDPEGDASNESGNGIPGGIILDNKIKDIVREQAQKITNDDRLQAFFDDPHKAIKIFLSSYAVEQGFIWYDANLECMGRILGFFINFLLRSKVLPEIERPLRRSLEIITTSITELPNISAMSKKLPDDFSAGCVACWGRKSESYTIVKVDVPESTLESIEETKIEEVETEDKRDKVEATQKSSSGWGETTSWKTDGETGGWGEPVDLDPTEFDGPPETADVSHWNIEEKSLLSLMGPTTFPLTHEPGIVEQSMRRIKAIVLPSSNPPKSPPLPEGVFAPDADAVENELERRFAKIVLEPMVDWDKGEGYVYNKPTILPTSVGAVVGADTPEAIEGGPKPFDPFNDDITLLVENNPDLLALMNVGLGMAGVWVQIARQNDATVVKKKKKGKSKKVIPSYWYMETLATTVVSFWTPQQTSTDE